MKKIAATITTYNRLEKLKKSLEHVLAQDIDYVVIVNNASTDETKDWLASLSDERLHILNLDENTGGAGGFYHGCKYATEKLDADWVLIFDDDAYPRDDLISKFKALEVSEDTGAVSCKVVTPDGKVADFNRPGLNPFKSLGRLIKYFFVRDSHYLSYDQLEKSNDISVDYSSFVGCFVKTKIIKEELGLPRKELFIYCDDWLYTLELSMLGYRNAYHSDLVFYHDSATFVDNYDDQIWKKYYAYRNSLLFYRTAAGLVFPLVFLMKLAKWLFDTRLYKKKKEYLGTLVRACKDGLFSAVIARNGVTKQSNAQVLLPS
ncbi:MAG: glycosyltransferase [Candidatus Melainabacteria bacterium]|nr:glycosyltransferase [Candidatus Melainabacteria bacterium]